MSSTVAFLWAGRIRKRPPTLYFIHFIFVFDENSCFYRFQVCSYSRSSLFATTLDHCCHCLRGLDGGRVKQGRLKQVKNKIPSVGKRVKALRLAKSFSMRALADVLNSDKNELSRIEEAQINTSIMMGYDLSGAFGMEVWELFALKSESDE